MGNMTEEGGYPNFICNVMVLKKQSKENMVKCLCLLKLGGECPNVILFLIISKYNKK